MAVVMKINIMKIRKKKKRERKKRVGQRPKSTSNQCYKNYPGVFNGQLLTSETLRGMGTSFGCSDLWDRLGGQVLVMIGQWYPKQPLTNHKQCLSTKTIPESLRRVFVAIFTTCFVQTLE